MEIPVLVHPGILAEAVQGCLGLSRAAHSAQEVRRVLCMGLIDPDSPATLSEQVTRIVRERIASGEYSGRLPSDFQLSRDLGVARGTVRQGLEPLVAEGLIVRVPGRGSFVAR